MPGKTRDEISSRAGPAPSVGKPVAVRFRAEFASADWGEDAMVEAVQDYWVIVAGIVVLVVAFVVWLAAGR